MYLGSSFFTIANVAASTATVAENPVAHKASLLDPAPTFIITALNLLVLYFILKKLLFDKFTIFMDKRSRSIESALEESRKAKEFAEATRTEYNEKIKNAHLEIEKMLADAKVDVNKQSEEMIKSAKEEAHGLLAKARTEIEREKELMLKEIRNEVASLALAAASKVIEANLDTESNQRFVEKFLDEAGVA